MSSDGLFPLTVKLTIVLAVLLAFVLLVVGELVEVKYGLSFWSNVLQELASVVLISGTIALIFEYLTRQREAEEREFEAQRQEMGLEAIYRMSESAAMRARVEELISESKRVALVGTAINLLDDANIWDSLIGRAKAGDAKVEIYLANPFSRHVNDRLFEEEVNRPPIIGRPGIMNRIERLLIDQTNKGIPTSQLEVRLFNHYPTAALFVFDRHIVVYHYYYQQLGNLSPAFCYHQRNGLASHYLEVFNRIKRDSVPAELVMREQGELQHSQEWANELSWFAVYLIPERDSEFYRVWSELIGYDVWREEILPSPPEIEGLRGDAHSFGCHITLMDAMGVWSKAQLDTMRHELRSLASQYEPMRLRNLGYLREFKKNALVVGFADDSGQLESLQAELMVHFATQAAVSNYQIRGHPAAALDLSNDRTRNMIERYHTPFCLNEFRPHVTVLGDLQNTPFDSARKIVHERGGEILDRFPLHFDKICFMERNGDGFWRIGEYMRLGVR